MEDLVPYVSSEKIDRAVETLRLCFARMPHAEREKLYQDFEMSKKILWATSGYLRACQEVEAQKKNKKR